MMTLPDFIHKKMVFVFLNIGERISFNNDNVIVKTKDDVTRLQMTCYQVFALFIIGSFTLTTGIIQRSHKFAFPIFLMTGSFKVYDQIGHKMEGNVLLRRIHYAYDDIGYAKEIVKNKIKNQISVLKEIRSKSDELVSDIKKINNYLSQVDSLKGSIHELLGIEGNTAKSYFKHEFSNMNWKGRKPRAKLDFINATLDIGYTILFNFIDALLRIYGFDTYCGVLHNEFYMRKSLVCDLVEPFRVLIDVQVKKSVNLGQFKEDDFSVINHEYRLDWKNNKKYISLLAGALIERQNEIFMYIQSYYRFVMKRKSIENFPNFEW